ncbi:hypothetical protein PBCVNEJV1_611L [Paramecium bursaria Chlorella virus NE-JV-1]|nr:hypothetical protein PBCVNEJV1_611L [Paramecium bursaria Chlorella virus NE-JV-1]
MSVEASPGPLSAHFPKHEIRVHFDSLTIDEHEDGHEDEHEDEHEHEHEHEHEEVEEVEKVEKAEEDAKVAEDAEDEEVEETEEAEDDTKTNAGPPEPHPSPEEEETTVVYYEDASTEVGSFSDMRKNGGVYVVPFSSIVVQTPVLVLEKLVGKSAFLKVPRKFAAFVEEIEGSILEATKRNKSMWFREDLDEETITAGFKSFLDGNVMKVKVDDDCAIFDERENLIEDFETPARVRCILEASDISFGKLEFGVVFSMTQVQLVKHPKCKITKPRISYFE